MARTAYLFHLYMKHCATRAQAVLIDFMEYTFAAARPLFGSHAESETASRQAVQ
jgi:hypothetical protein